MPTAVSQHLPRNPKTLLIKFPSLVEGENRSAFSVINPLFIYFFRSILFVVSPSTRFDFDTSFRRFSFDVTEKLFVANN